MSTMVTKRRWVSGLIVGAAVLTGIGTAGVMATGVFSAPPKGPTIAVVDLETLINGLDEKKAKGEEFKKAFDAKNKELEALGAKIKERETAVNAMPPGAARGAAAEELRDMVIRAEMEKKIATLKIDGQQADLFHELYTKVDAAIRQIAERNKYDMVLVSDEAAKVPKGSSETVLRGITLKRMLYVHDELDITEEVIREMNNAFANPGARTNAPAPKPAGP